MPDINQKLVPCLWGENPLLMEVFLILATGEMHDSQYPDQF
jgi:hypothetical protein